jgi:uncharacterized protein YjiS (DUF1127 family)
MATTREHFYPELNADAALAASIGQSLRGLGQRFARLMDAWHEVRARASAMEELSSLTDSELSDIGLSRCMIPQLWRK